MGDLFYCVVYLFGGWFDVLLGCCVYIFGLVAIVVCWYCWLVVFVGLSCS